MSYVERTLTHLRNDLQKLEQRRERLQFELDSLDEDRKAIETAYNALISLTDSERETTKVQARADYPPAVPDDVLACLHDGMTSPGEIGKKLKTHYMTVTHTLRALARDGQVKQLGKGNWQLAREHNWIDYRKNELATD